MHGAEDTTRKGVSRKPRKEFAAAGEDLYTERGAHLNDFGGVPRDVPALAEEREGNESGLKRHLNDFRTLGDEDAVEGIEAVAQLRLGERGEHTCLPAIKTVNLCHCHHNGNKITKKR